MIAKREVHELKQHESKQIPEEQGKVGYKRPPIHTRFEKGISGNPGGVKKGTIYVSEAYKRLMAMPMQEYKAYKPKNPAEAMAMQQIKNALGLSKREITLPSAKEIADRTEGRPAQKVQMEGSLQISHEQQRQVRFLVHTIKKTQQQLGDVTIEEAWGAVELVEREKFGEDVRHLRLAVFAALGVGDEKPG
jgi:hypothetical protein